MPEFRKVLDIYQGYNFKRDKQTPVGFITKLKIGETEIKADQTCKDPTASTTDMKVVSVLNNILWGTGVTDAVYLSGQVSITNKQNIAALTGLAEALDAPLGVREWRRGARSRRWRRHFLHRRGRR